MQKNRKTFKTLREQEKKKERGRKRTGVKVSVLFYPRRVEDEEWNLEKKKKVAKAIAIEEIFNDDDDHFVE